MQEQPITRTEFDELKEEVRQLKQETEPMRLERRLSIPEANTLQRTFDEVARANTEIGLLKGSIIALKTDMERRFDAIASMQKQILDKLPPKEQ